MDFLFTSLEDRGNLAETGWRVDDDLRPLNFDQTTARRRIWDRSASQLLVEAATSSWHAPGREVRRCLDYRNLC